MRLSDLYVINRDEARMVYEALCEFRTPRWQSASPQELLPLHQLIENLKNFIHEKQEEV